MEGGKGEKYIYLTAPPNLRFPFPLPGRPPSAQRSPRSPFRFCPARAGGPGAAAGPDRLPGRAEPSQTALASLSAGGGRPGPGPGPRPPGPSCEMNL